MKILILFFSVFAGLEAQSSSCNDSHLLAFLRSHYQCPSQQNYHSIAINFKTYYFSHYSRFMNACTLEGCYNGGEGIHGPILVSYCVHTLERHTRVPASSNLVIPKVCKNKNIKPPQDPVESVPYRHQRPQQSPSGGTIR